MRTLIFALGIFGLTTLGVARADEAKPEAKTEAKAEAKKAPKAAAQKPADSPERQALLEELNKAKTQLADDKKALAEAKKGKDKDAIKAAQDKVKADGKAIFEIQNKLHALKAAKKPADKPAAEPAKAN